MPPLRLILDPPADGAWNMAVDEVLLKSAAEDGVATLRFYGWSEPTLSLGYFQAYRDRLQHAASGDCPLVRRASGGGAILHHHELTYCFAAPSDSTWSRDPGPFYRLFHDTLILALRRLSPADSPQRWCNNGPLPGPLPEYRERENSTRPTSSPEAVCPPPAGEEPFLCFQRRTADDVVLGEAKIAGSAQRRRRGGTAQHGSVLLQRSLHAPELPGWNDLAGCGTTATELRQPWLQFLKPALETLLGSSRLPPAFGRTELTQRERVEAADLAESKYAHPHWTERK